MKFRILILIFFVTLGGCRNQQLNPPRLILDSETGAPIQLFVQASILLSQAYGFDPIPYEEIRLRSERAGFRTIPFAAPDTIRATPQLMVKMREEPGAALAEYLIQTVGRKPLVKYYIRTGLRASQLICRNYLTRIDEGNQYLEFIKKEIGVASTFASGVLALVNANATISQAFLIAATGVNEGLDAYQEYRFLSIDRDTARVLVETAQNKLAEYYLNQIDLADDAKAIAEKRIALNSTAGGYTFSDALNAVSTIEYQCTREGIRYLLNRAVNNTPSNMDIDAATGTIMFKSAKVQEEGTGSETKSAPKSAPKAKNGSATTPPSISITGPNADAFEKNLDVATIKKWEKFCGLPETGQLGDKDSPLRKAINKFLGLPGNHPKLLKVQGEALNRKIDNKETGCVPVA